MWSKTGPSSTVVSPSELLTRPPGALLLSLVLILISLSLGVAGQGMGVTHCGGYLNASQGVIQTPDFPVRFPTPISCQWLIHAPPGRKIVLYFTQYYMRESFQLHEYDFYQDAENFRGKHDLGEISFEEEVTSYTVYKPYLMLRFQVQKIGNIHLRVFDFLLDVYGFNITYEIVDDRAPVRTDACSVFKCSFLGNCLATRNFETYKCHCFPGFFGEDCQYGPYCNPDKGINMCWNGGKCRYFFGSLVNTCECPPGYYGVLCEKKQEDFGNIECEKIGCNQKCIMDEGSDTYRCICNEGYRLMEDNMTCMEKGRMRYTVTTRCSLSRNGSIKHDSWSTECPEFRAELTDSITTRLTPRLKEFDNFSVVNVSLGDKNYFYIEVIFIGEKADSKQARRGMYDVISSGDVCGCNMDKDYMNFDAKPALHMLTLENYDDKPILVGHLLTLVCRAKGSNGLQFQWLKDGAPVHVHRTSRNMWITTVPSSDDESRMSVLNIDHAHMLDEGDFTCQVTDWDETKSRTVTVTVTPEPHVEVTPLVTTVLEGETAHCKCLSGDDERGDFKYRWLRGDEQLTSTEKTNAEVVEDLFPIGSRLTVRTAACTERYTCVVTAPSGQANSSCQINVAKVSMETRSCAEEEHLGVAWQQTAENQTDIKPCPGNGRVLATRRCSCWSDTACKWEDPNFSKCTSLQLLRVEQELMKLQLGYMVNNVSSVLHLLQRFLAEQNTTTHQVLTGDLQLSMAILSGCQEYRRKFLALGPGGSGTDQPSSLQETVELASILLTRSRSASLEERREMSMGQSILDLFESIRKDPRVLEAITSGPVTSPAIELQVRHVSSSSRWDSAPLYAGTHAAVTLPLSLQANTLSQGDAPHRARRQPRSDQTFTMVTAVYDNIQEMLSNDSLEGTTYSINSQMVSVGPYVRWDDLDSDQANVSRIVDIRFEHYSRPIPVRTHNITTCLHWRSPREGETFGAYTTGRCSLIQSQTYSTTCRCLTPGHFVAVMTSDTTIVMGGVEEDLGIIPLIGCTLSLTGMVASLVVHLCFWRYMKDNLKVITLNFCLAVIALNCILLATFSYKQSLMVCRVQFLAIAICFLAAFTFVTLELFHIRFTMLKAKLVLSPLKLCLIGWGVVCCVMVAVLTCGQLIGYSDMVGRYCWLVSDTWESYALLAPFTIIFTVYIGLLAVLIRDITCHNHCPPQKEKRKYIFYVCRSVVQQTWLVLACIMSVVVVNCPLAIYQYIFAIALAVLGITYFAFHCVVMAKVRPDNLVSMKALAERYGNLLGPCLSRARSLLLNNHKTEMPSRESTGSFKAFLKPTQESKGSGSAEGTTSTVVDPAVIDPYVRDKRTYGKERKEQLRALLGTSSESGSSSKESDPRELLRSISSPADTSCVKEVLEDSNVDEDFSADTLPPNYRTITEYIASLQKQNQTELERKQQQQQQHDGGTGRPEGTGGSTESYRSLSRENHNSLCNCGTCGSTMPFKPARGRSFIVSDGGGSSEPALEVQHKVGHGSSRNSVNSSSGRPLPNHIPNPFPNIMASTSSLSAASSSSRSGTSRGGRSINGEEDDYQQGVELSPLDSPLSCQLEPIMSYVLTEPQGSPKSSGRSDSEKDKASKGNKIKGSKRQILT